MKIGLAEGNEIGVRRCAVCHRGGDREDGGWENDFFGFSSGRFEDCEKRVYGNCLILHRLIDIPTPRTGLLKRVGRVLWEKRITGAVL